MCPKNFGQKLDIEKNNGFTGIKNFKSQKFNRLNLGFYYGPRNAQSKN